MELSNSHLIRTGVDRMTGIATLSVLDKTPPVNNSLLLRDQNEGVSDSDSPWLWLSQLSASDLALTLDCSFDNVSRVCLWVSVFPYRQKILLEHHCRFIRNCPSRDRLLHREPLEDWPQWSWVWAKSPWDGTRRHLAWCYCRILVLSNCHAWVIKSSMELDIVVMALDIGVKNRRPLNKDTFLNQAQILDWLGLSIKLVRAANGDRVSGGTVLLRYLGQRQVSIWFIWKMMLDIRLHIVFEGR